MSKKTESVNKEIARLGYALAESKTRYALSMEMYREEMAGRIRLEQSFLAVKAHLMAVVKQAIGKKTEFVVPTAVYEQTGTLNLKINGDGKQLRFSFEEAESLPEAPNEHEHLNQV